MALAFAAIFAALIAGRPDTPACAEPARTAPVFVLHSYSQEYPWTRRQHEGFTHALGAAGLDTSDLRVEYLDTKRVPYTPASARTMAAHLAGKYAGYRPRAVYVSDDNALSFALTHLTQIFPRTPVFFSGVNDDTIRTRLDPDRVTGVFEHKEIAPNLTLMRRLFPGVRDVLVVGDDSETFAAIRRDISAELANQPDIRARFVSAGRIDRLVEALRGQPERIVFLTTLGAVSDVDGRTLSLPETIAAIVQSGRFIVLSMEDAYLYPGVLGGFVTSGQRQGAAAADLVARHLAGAPVRDLPPVGSSPNEYIFDASELQRAGLTLPDDIARVATLVNRVPTFYERNLAAIVRGLYLLGTLFLALLSVSLLVVLRKNREIARTTAELRSQAERMAETQDSLTRAQRIAGLGNWDWRINENKLYWSDEIYRLFGLAPDQFVASYDGFLARIHPDDRQAVTDAVSAALEQGAPYDITHRIVLPDGQIRHVHENAEIMRDASGRPERMIGTVRDVTRQFRTDQALRESEEKLRTVIEGFPVILWVIDANGVFVLSRGAGLKLLGLGPDEVVGKSVFDLYRDHPKVLEDIRRVLGGESFVSTHWIGTLAFEVRYSPLRDRSGALSGAIGVAADVTERKVTEDRLAFLANYDPVTMLPNRHLFMDRLSHAMQIADRNGTNVALLFIDLDSFKTINDTLGHAAGDTLLVQVAQRLTAAVRGTDTVSRLGGDEFTIVLEGLNRGPDAADVAQNVLAAVARPYQIMSRELFISTSIGIALYPADGASAETLLMNADAAMYRAKESGRSNFQFFTEEINASARDRLELESQLRRGLDRGEFALHYQPLIDARSGQVVGFEALLRWTSPTRGPVSPGVFIPILEESGLIVPVGEWVLREASAWANRLPDGDTLLIAVNLSARQFRLAELHHAVEAALAWSGLPAHRLELEITESSLIDPKMNVSAMDRLKHLGARLTVDDFGTGYSSLSYLKRFPIDCLKIDASFVGDVAVDKDDAEIVTAIIGLAHNLDLRVVAEGVETEAQLEFLLSRNCDEIQGYLIARPMPGADAAAWLTHWRGGAYRAFHWGR